MSIFSLLYTYKNYSTWTQQGRPIEIIPTIIACESMGASGRATRDIINKYIEDEQIKECSLKEDLKSSLADPPIIDECKGNKEAYFVCLNYYEKLIELNGITSVLTDFLKDYEGGLFSADLIPLICLGYGLELGEKKPIAAGMAMVITGYEEYNFKKNLPKTHYPYEHFIEISKDMTHKKTLVNESKYEKINQLLNDRSTSNKLISLEDKHTNILFLRALAIRLYAEAKDRDMINILAGTHSIRILIPYLQDEKNTISNYLQYIQALILITEEFEISSYEYRQEYNKEFSLINQLAISTKKIDTIRLVYSAYREARYLPSSFYNIISYDIVRDELNKMN